MQDSTADNLAAREAIGPASPKPKLRYQPPALISLTAPQSALGGCESGSGFSGTVCTSLGNGAVESCSTGDVH